MIVFIETKTAVNIVYTGSENQTANKNLQNFKEKKVSQKLPEEIKTSIREGTILDVQNGDFSVCNVFDFMIHVKVLYHNHKTFNQPFIFSVDYLDNILDFRGFIRGHPRMGN